MQTLNIYSNPDYFTKERDKIFNTRWLLLCHESELAQSGQYLTFDIGGEPIVSIKGDDGKVKSFFNICVHRGFPLFLKNAGTLNKNSIQCQYHGWKYTSTGERTASSDTCTSLQSIETKIYFGFVFVKIRPNTTDESLNNNRLFNDFSEAMINKVTPINQNTFTKVVPTNWKLFIENTLEGDHVPSVHASLNSLIGSQYFFDSEKSILKTTANFLKANSASWTVNAYRSVTQKVAQPFVKTPQWVFYYLFPNTQITVSPEQISYLQAIPINESSTLIRGKSLTLNKTDRNHKLARYLNLRLGKQVFKEDHFILKQIQKSYGSREFKYAQQRPQRDESLTFFRNQYEKAMSDT